jgi:hypothetical protein
VETDSGKLIADWEAKTQTSRQNLRVLNPELDAWLLFWGDVTSPRTPEARILANEFLSKYRPGAPKFVVE